MKSYGVTIQMKATEQYFLVVLFIMLYKVVRTFESVDEILWCDHSNESSLPVLTHDAICLSKFLENEIRKFGQNLPLATFGSKRVKIQALVVQRPDSAIHRINHYPVDSVIRFPNTYPLDSDLSGG